MHVRTTKFIAATSAFVFISLISAASLYTPTYAVTVDLGKTVTTVANTVPVVNTIAPLLMTPVTVPIVTPVLVPSSPAVPSMQTQPVPIVPDTSASAMDTPTADNNANAVTTFTPAGGLVQTSNGLSVIAKQDEILEAPAHTPSPGLMYSTNQISPKLANTLFYLGVTGVLVGGCVLFATNPRMRISA